MTPAEKAQIDEHVQAIAKILYADADKRGASHLCNEHKCLVIISSKYDKIESLI